MEFVKFECEENNNSNSFFYYTNIIKNDDKYLLITVEDTNINFVKIIVNNEIRYINGNNSRNWIEIAPFEEYRFEIFDKDDIKYVNKIDFSENFLLINYSKTTIPSYIKTNMKILFFEPVDFNSCNESCIKYFTFSISTNNFEIKKNQILTIQNFNIDKDFFKKPITELITNGVTEDIIIDKIVKRFRPFEIINFDVFINNRLEKEYYYVYKDIKKFFNLNCLSLKSNAKTIITTYDNIKNFKYYVDEENEINKYKLYLTKCNDISVKIKIPISSIIVMNYSNIDGYIIAPLTPISLPNSISAVINKTNEEKHNLFKTSILTAFEVKPMYVVIDISENNECDCDDTDGKILNEEIIKNQNKQYIDALEIINESLKTNVQILNNKNYLLQKNVEEIKKEFNELKDIIKSNNYQNTEVSSSNDNEIKKENQQLHNKIKSILNIIK